MSVHGDSRGLLIVLGIGLLLAAAGCQGPTSPARTTPGAAPAAAAPVHAATVAAPSLTDFESDLNRNLAKLFGRI